MPVLPVHEECVKRIPTFDRGISFISFDLLSPVGNQSNILHSGDCACAFDTLLDQLIVWPVGEGGGRDQPHFLLRYELAHALNTS